MFGTIFNDVNKGVDMRVLTNLGGTKDMYTFELYVGFWNYYMYMLV